MATETLNTLSAGGKTVWQYLLKLNIYIYFDPATPFLGTHPRETSAYVHQKTCTNMFVPALFIEAKNWRQFKYLSIVHQIVFYTIECYTAMK